MTVIRLSTDAAGDIDTVGGKGASLGKLTSAGLPVPGGFVVTVDTYRRFVEDAGIAEELVAAVDVDVEDSAALADAEERARELILGTPLPESVTDAILAAYDDLDGEPDVAVRSSATAEDLPDASFAGQQETFLNVSRDDLLDRVKECWASLFTQRAIYYRQEQGFADDVGIAVVVQRMVDADKSGVMFTSHPSTGARRLVVEAAWGLGEAVVSGAVSPDNYVLDRDTDEISEVTVATKKVMYVRDEETGETVEREVSETRSDERVLSEGELRSLRDVGETIEAYYETPQDVEWAMKDGDIFVLQSRPITTVTEPTGDGDAVEADGLGSQADRKEESERLVNGLSAGPGTAMGPVRIVTKLDHLDKVKEGDVIVTEHTTPDMVPAMKRAAGLVTDEGGMTSHAAIVSRELGVPAVIGTGVATTALADGQTVTIDGDRGVVTDEQVVPTDETTEETDATETNDVRPALARSVRKPLTATEVKVNISIPEAAERAAATGADGVGLLRMEHMVLSLGKTPETYVSDHGEDAFVGELVDSVRAVAEEFYPRPVRIRTLDAPTDEFRQLDGGGDEPNEHNPMLGYRGIRRSLDRPETFRLELEAFRRLFDLGYDNVEMMFPLVTDAEDVLRARSAMESVGIDPTEHQWGVMIETPASALCIDEICETGVDFVSLGTNDLTQYTLAVDRNNERVADRYDELHPAVLRLMRETIETCRERDVATSICGQAASKPRMVRELVDAGITSLSVNVDAVHDVQDEAKRVEQKFVLDSVR